MILYLRIPYTFYIIDHNKNTPVKNTCVDLNGYEIKTTRQLEVRRVRAT